jgi:GNAT superfamily N-acetyltransferase
MKSPEPSLRFPVRRGPVEYTLGNEADQEAVYQTLLHVFHGPDRESFLGALADPAYKPEQRLLAKVESKVASHLHLTERTVRYGQDVTFKLNGVMWVGTLPEYRGLGFAQNLMKLAASRSRQQSALVQALTTSMPSFYKTLGFGVCGRACLAVIPSRALPSSGEGASGVRGGGLVVRPWRQVELGGVMKLYDRQFGGTTGTILRSEEYWRWIIGRKYAHMIWVACVGDTVKGYAFAKDHRVLELATDPDEPGASVALLARIRSEAIERAYPEVVIHAPSDHPVVEVVTSHGGRFVDSEFHEGAASMYMIPDIGAFLQTIAPELHKRAKNSGSLPQELGIQVGNDRWLVRVDRRGAKIEPDKLSRRYLSLSPGAFARLALGHSGIECAMEDDDVAASTGTAVESAAVLFPISPLWRSPLDSATA